MIPSSAFDEIVNNVTTLVLKLNPKNQTIEKESIDFSDAQTYLRNLQTERLERKSAEEISSLRLAIDLISKT